MKKVAVVTTTRADYGILKKLIIGLQKETTFTTQVIATGMHLSKEFGNTVCEIEKDGVNIYKRIPILTEGDTPFDATKSMANAVIGFGTYFKDEHPDLLIILGDRTEILGICAAALNERITIAHLHGGELTEGAVDDCIRHAVTKMSYLHFTSTEEYRKRVIQLGENPSRVYNVGALGVENVLHEQLLSFEELQKSLSFLVKGRKYAVVTYHPVTLDYTSIEDQVGRLLGAMEEHKEMDYLVTKANSDPGGRKINEILEAYATEHSNVLLVTSLGMKRYLSAVKYCEFVMGNSSSGIIEAPSFGVPTINIGDRQKGRVQAKSILNCDQSKEAIASAMNMAMSEEYRMMAMQSKNPYGDGKTSERIISILREYLTSKSSGIDKKFYDIKNIG